MHWDTRRQLLYGFVLIIVLGVLGAGTYFGFFYHESTCLDGVQNGMEEGIDCGGACGLLCTGPVVSVVWARAVPVAPGVYHAVAMVRNPDTNASGEVPYTVSLFDASNILIATRTGSLTLLPGEVAPLFEPNLNTGTRIPERTFVDIDAGTWERALRVVIPVRVVPGNSVDEVNARHALQATVSNIGATPLSQVMVTALLYDAESNLVAASQTTVLSLALHEVRDIVFTWPSPFSTPVVAFDLIPRFR